MAILLQDDFNRANNVTDPGSPQVGGPYAVRNSAVAGINGNALYFSSVNSTGTGSHLTFPGAVDVDLSVTLTNNPINSTGGVIFRWVDTSNFWFAGLQGNGTYGIYRWTAGSNPAGSISNTTQVVGDVLRLVAVSDRIWLLVNGRITCVAQDQHVSAATGTCGLAVRSSSYRFDNLLVQDGAALADRSGGSPSTQFATTGPTTSGWVPKGRATKTLDTLGAP